MNELFLLPGPRSFGNSYRQYISRLTCVAVPEITSCPVLSLMLLSVATRKNESVVAVAILVSFFSVFKLALVSVHVTVSVPLSITPVVAAAS